MAFMLDQDVSRHNRERDLLMAGSPGQPTGRPYGSPDDLDGAAPRPASFQTGQAGDPSSAATVTVRPNAGLTADSLQFRAQTPAGYRPSSVLTPHHEESRRPGYVSQPGGSQIP